MRWSWESFAAGLLGGAALAGLLWLALGERPDTVYLLPDTDHEPSAPQAAAVVPDTPSPETDGLAEPRTSGRRAHVNPVAREPGENAPPPIEGSESAPIRAGRVLFDSSGRQTLRIEFSGGSDGWVQVLSALSGGDPAPALLKWSRKRAGEVFPGDGPVDRAESASRLAAESYATRAEGLGLSMRVMPAPLDVLLDAARDTAYPDLRGAALLAAAERAVDDDDVRAAILELALDGDSNVRRTATSLLGRLGEEGARRASAIILSGDYTPEIVAQLTAAVAKHGDVAAFLGAAPPPDAAFSVVQQLAERATDPQTDADRRLAEALPQLVRPLLETQEADQHASLAFGQLVALGHGPFLRGIATTPIYSNTVRASAVRSALQHHGTRADGISAAAAILTDPTVDVALARAVLGAIQDDEWLDDSTLRGALEAAARSHPSAWVRDDVRAKLDRHAPGGRGTLIVHEAAYGSGDGWVDVTAVLRGAVREGALSIQASNDLAGDPKVGAHKTLRVEYSLGGERRLKTVGENGRLTIP